MRFVILLRLGPILVLALVAGEVRADLSAKQARKLITRMAGVELPSSAVRVKRVTSTNNSSAEATAEIQAIFRLAINRRGYWRVAELRVGQGWWEELEPGAESEIGMSASACDSADLASRRPATEPSTKRARCLIASVLDVPLPSDAVRVKAISPLELPLASRPSALVESLVSAEFRFSRDQGGWTVTGVRTGNREWISPETLLLSANEAKRKQARDEMEAIAHALAKFRVDRQTYVSSDSQAVLIDYLSPRYLSRVIRIDPWQEPYRYRGARDTFTLRSLGPDRKENTADDIVVSSPL
jgi:Type II secretion system (T2SS), protein G